MRAPNGHATSQSSSYQHVVVSGTRYDRGFSHGQQARSKIKRSIEYYKSSGKLPSSVIIQKMVENVYLPGIKKFYPSVLEELRGITEGAQIPLNDIIMLNSRYDLARTKRFFPSNDKKQKVESQALEHNDLAHECTSMAVFPVATATGHIFTGQNWDNAAHLYVDDTIIYLEEHPSDNSPSLFVVTEAGQLGRNGMNSAGLGLTANSLMSSEDYCPIPYTDKDGNFVDVKPVPLLPISLIRRKYLESTNFSEALQIVQNSPRHVSNNITVSTSEGFALCLEMTPSRIYRVYPSADSGYIVHSNHFMHLGFQARPDIHDEYPGGSSWFRHQRYEAAIRPYRKGQLTEELLLEGFKDHLGFPASLCEHLNENTAGDDGHHDSSYAYSGPILTVVCVLYNLTQRKIKVCRGPPCAGDFQEFILRKEGTK